ncbi:Bromodomain protein [Aspergillus sclerotialis]|uniref:Bromodomain protein n=1 Tax=Aspergillus sclerotialis TaxID=2070753 RepID=A0A3A2ZHF8_9EURO|nr:Bromodomain protein [Aspergillus sclerotialis]
MPPPSAYTPFESLLFFQSLAAFDSRPASFASISDTLRNNSFIRQNADFNPERLTPEALEELYTTLVRDGLNPDGTLNYGHNGQAENPVASNPKKRKITSPRPEGVVDGAAIPLSNEEKRFCEIRDEIERLQKEAQEAPAPAGAQAPTPNIPLTKQEHGPKPTDIDAKHVEPTQQPTPGISKLPVEQTVASGTTVGKPLAEQPQVQLNVPQPPAETTGSNVEQVHKPAPQPINQPQNPALQQPQPAPQVAAGQPSHPSMVNGKAPSAPQHVPPSGEQVNVPAVPQVPPPSTASRPETGATPAAKAPPIQPQQAPSVPIQPQPSVSPVKPASKEIPSANAPVAAQARPQGQPSFQQWALNEPSQTPRTPASANLPAPQTTPAASKRPIQPSHPQQPSKPPAGKPYQPPYTPTVPTTPKPETTPVHPIVQGRGHGATNIAAGASLSEPRNVRRPPIDTHISLTPWKKLPRLSIPDRPRSPDRPRPEDISPISDRAPSPIGLPEAPPEGSGPRRRKRRTAEEKEQNVPAADVDHRANKRAKVEQPAPVRKKRDGSTPSSKSREEGSPTELPQARIKHETTATPASVPEDTEPMAKPASDRKGAATAQPGRRPGRGRPKRKRSVSEAVEPEPAQPEPEPSRPDPNQYVLCARNFPRTSNPIINDVTTHKHASIFTKPLTERDAPGYRDLIYRPQDLKSIKSSISQGSKAVSAASETVSTPAADGESPTPAAGTPSKNTVLMLQKTEDVIPPKAIVNSAQLEKELIRVFANAVMYNPTPQRGFGPSFPMISDSGSRAGTEVPEADEGGIVNDAMEMFDDVEKAVTRWRAAERTSDELANKNVVAIRRGSISDLNPDSTDDNKG